MSLSDGDSADDGDVWFRVATQDGHIRRGRVHHGAFGGKNVISMPPREKNRPWDRELSGRLRSLAGSVEDIEKDAIEFCEAETKRGGGKKTFYGVIYTRVADAKLIYEDTVSTGVHFTPLDRDKAHGDFTFTGWAINTKPEEEKFFLWLSDVLQALHYPGQLQHLPDPDAQTKSIFDRLKELLNYMVPFIKSRKK